MAFTDSPDRQEHQAAQEYVEALNNDRSHTVRVSGEGDVSARWYAFDRTHKALRDQHRRTNGDLSPESRRSIYVEAARQHGFPAANRMVK